jgi:hypothetical protein
MSDEPREYTNEEVREKFLEYCWLIIGEWERYSGKTPNERVEGAVFSLLVMLDGEAASLPAFIVAPLPAKGDKEYFQEEGENWYPVTKSVSSDIGGCLHENFHRVGRKLGHIK